MEENKIPQTPQNLSPPPQVVNSVPAVPVTQKPEVSVQSGETSPEKAGFLIRAAAYILDSILLTIPTIIFMVILPDQQEYLNLILGLFTLVYFILGTYLYGKTLGKKYFYLKVVTVDGGSISVGKAILREFIGKLLSSLILNLGFAWVIWDKNKQSWHDKLAKTYVISEKPVGKGKKVFAYILVLGLPTIAILGILVAIVLVAINPAEQVEKARQQQELERFQQQNLQYNNEVQHN